MGAAIGTSALRIFAIVVAGIGALINTVFCIALSMTSSGGTVPLAAIPEPFRWLSHTEPFYPIVNGMRALLYYDANPAAGLADAWIRIGVGVAAGLALGLIVAWAYDRIPRFTRHPATA